MPSRLNVVGRILSSVAHLRPAVRSGIVAVVVGVAGCAGVGRAAPVVAPRVLVLNSYHPGYNWSDGEQAGLLQVLTEARPDVLPVVEYLDWRRFPDPAREPQLLQQLGRKYGTAPFDLVIVLDEPAFDLVVNHRARFGEQTPVVFGGINDADPAVIGKFPRLTGVAQTYDFGGTLDLIRRLQPRLKKLVVAHCRTESGLATRRAFERHLAGAPVPWAIEWKDDPWNGAELIDAAARPSGDSAFLLLSIFRDRDGRVLADDAEFARELARRSAVPVYFLQPPIVRHFGDSSWSAAAWQGVGGSLLAPDLHGAAVARMALRVLAGEPIERIPMLAQSPSRVAVTYPQLVRHGLDEAALPENAVLYGKPPSFWTRHRGEILVAVVLTIGFGGIIFGLLWVLFARRKNEAALRLSESRFRQLFEFLPDGLLKVGTDGVIVMANARAEAMFGYGPGELIGRPVEDLVPAGDRAAHREHRQRFADAPERRAMTAARALRGVRKDGTRFPIEVSLSPVETADGRRVVAAVRDVTERHEVEEALREIRENLEDAQRVARLGSWRLDLRTQRGHWSAEMFRLFERDPALGAPSFAEFEAMVHPDDCAALRESFARALRHVARDTLEFRRVTRDGTIRHFFATLVPEQDADGRPTRLNGTTQDITRRKEAERQLRAHEEELRRLNAELEHRVAERTLQLDAKNKELESFTYAVSHDLKAPLRGLDGYSRLLLEDHADSLDAEGREFLANIRRAADQMNALISDLLTYSKLERRPFETSQVDPAALVRDLVESYGPELAGRDVAIRQQVPAVRLTVDSQGLLMALRNLLDNALKFTRQTPRAEIYLTGEVTAAGFLLVVRDNGPGFDPKFSERIFEIFQRLHRAEDYPGTGVGLAIVRKAMERMGGRAWAEAAPGRGAAFFLELPRGCLVGLPAPAEPHPVTA